MASGEAFTLAPADDEIINAGKVFMYTRVSKGSFVSIVAKKIAMGATFVLIDLPYGKGTKIEKLDRFRISSREF